MTKAFGFGVAATMVIGGAASADILYDNPVGAGGGTAVNQEFGDFPGYSTYLVADFNVPGALGYNLTSVAAPMTVNGAWAAVVTARLHLFPKVGALPDNITDDPSVSRIVTVSYDEFTGILSTVGLSLDVAAGDYWIGLTGIGDFGKVGQAFALEGANNAGNPDAARNPGGEFNFPAGTDWFAIQDFVNWGFHDFALTVEGDPILPSDLIWFTDQADFEAFNAGEGKVLRGIEDYEEAVLDPGQGVGVDDPLVSGVPNPPVFPNGLTGLPNLQVQANTLGGNPTVPSPHGANGLAAFAAPGGNFVSDVVISNFFGHSHDLIFLTDEKTGVGGNMMHFTSAGTVVMRVYDINNNFLGMMASPADPAGTNFLGVWSPDPIGRVNLFSTDNGAEGMDNIQAWESQDCDTCDADCNGVIDAFDIEPFLDLLFDPDATPCNTCTGDVNGDGNIDAFDIEPFIECLFGFVKGANAQGSVGRIYFDLDGNVPGAQNENDAPHPGVTAKENPMLDGGGRLFIYWEFGGGNQNVLSPNYDITVDGGTITAAWNYNNTNIGGIGFTRWEQAGSPPTDYFVEPWNFPGGPAFNPTLVGGPLVSLTSASVAFSFGLNNDAAHQVFDNQLAFTDGPFGSTLLGYIDVSLDAGQSSAEVFITVGQQGLAILGGGPATPIFFGFGDAPVGAGDVGIRTGIAEATIVSEPCPWDLDGSGIVGATDLLALLVSWGKCPGCPADFDDNGIVGATDLLALLVNWGPCPK
ncbi:MAG: hypothetical protein V3T84_17290 [Phycisphaerales bacterium]